MQFGEFGVATEQERNMANRLYDVASGRRSKDESIQWDDLLLGAVREHYSLRGRPLLHSPITLDSKNRFVKRLFSNVQTTYQADPEEISRSTVDVHEKIFTNTGGFEDETSVAIVSDVENTEVRNYQETTTKGIKWDVDTNVGLQFGLPQVGVGGNANIGGSYGRSRSVSVAWGKHEEKKHKHQSRHEEKLSIPPGKIATLRMSAQKVRYKLQYAIEYSIPKSDGVFVRTDLCGLGLWYTSVFVSASQLLNPLPGFREDDEFVYFTQEGELRWIADRMTVTKTLKDD